MGVQATDRPTAYDAAAAMAAELIQKEEDRLRGLSSVSPRHSNRASELADPCVRRLYLKRVAWQSLPPPDPDLQSIFEEGKLHEPAVIRLLDELGYRVLREQVSIHDRGLNISGTPEGYIDVYGTRVLIEIKTCAPWAWDKLSDSDSVRNGGWLMARHFGQMQTYLFLTNLEAGLFIFKNKLTGRLKAIAVALDYDYAEGLLKKAEAVNEAVRTQEPPPFIEDLRECRRCAFLGSICQPPMDYGPGAAILTDDVLVEAERVYWETMLHWRRHEDCAKALKEAAKGTGRDMAMCGESVLTVSKHARKEYTVKAGEVVRVDIERPKVAE